MTPQKNIYKDHIQEIDLVQEYRYANKYKLYWLRYWYSTQSFHRSVWTYESECEIFIDRLCLCLGVVRSLGNVNKTGTQIKHHFKTCGWKYFLAYNRDKNNGCMLWFYWFFCHKNIHPGLQFWKHHQWSGVMVSVLVSSAVDRGFAKTKIGIC
jgi:hypothetical protein